MSELRENTFFGNKNDDAHEHMERVLEIVSLFSIPGVSQDALMLRVFLITLTGDAKRWTDMIPSGSINTWDFSRKPSSKGTTLLPRPPTSLRRFINSSKRAMRHCTKLGKGSSNIRTSNGNSDGIDATTSKLDSLGRDMKKLKENMHAIQVGCGLCGGMHLDKECLLNEEAIFADNGAPGVGSSSNYTNELLGVSFVSDSDMQEIKKEMRDHQEFCHANCLQKS
ncbi:hypothetical protein Tco_0228770 [Tanacetum coccineum]